MAARAQSRNAATSELRIAVMRLARRLRSQRAETGLSIGHIAALGSIERHEPITPGELAAHEKVQPPSMTRILTTLEERGFVTREPHPTDGRQSLLYVSPTGRAMLSDDRRRRDAWLAQRLEALTPAELQTLQQAAAIMDRLAGS